SPLGVADGTPLSAGFPAAVGMPANASCPSVAGCEGPISLRMAFSVTPSRCAIARLLIPWLFSISMLRKRFPEIRRRPRRQPLFSTECRHPALRIAPLVPPHGAHRSGKRPRHVRLLGEARLHQEHHRIGLGDRILGAIVMHRQPAQDRTPVSKAFVEKPDEAI